MFIDRGKGFNPDDMVELRTTRDGLYVVALKTLGTVWNLRFDPSSYPSQFEFHAFASFDLRSVKAFVGSRLSDAGRGIGRLPVCETIAEGDLGDLRGLGTRASPVNIRVHLDEVLRLAAARYSRPNSGPSSPASSHAIDRRRRDPLISFVAPVFDTPATYLDDLLGSFRVQEEGTWELILVDDGSTSPETMAWLDKQHHCPALKIIRRAGNDGIAVATNCGLAAAKGAWVGFIVSGMIHRSRRCAHPLCGCPASRDDRAESHGMPHLYGRRHYGPQARTAALQPQARL